MIIDLEANGYIYEGLMIEANAVIYEIIEKSFISDAVINVYTEFYLLTDTVIIEENSLSLNARAIIEYSNQYVEINATGYIQTDYIETYVGVNAYYTLSVTVENIVIADAEIFESTNNTEQYKYVYALATVEDSFYQITCSAHIIDIYEIYPGDIKIIFANAIIKTEDNTKNIVATGYIILEDQLINREKTFTSDALIITIDNNILIPHVFANILYNINIPYYDGKFYTQSSNSVINGVTVEPVEVSIVGVSKTLFADSLISENGTSVYSDGVVFEENVFVQFVTNAHIIMQNRKIISPRANIGTYLGAPLNIDCDAVVYSERIFPIPAKERIV
jgi:hypothetical protein